MYDGIRHAAQLSSEQLGTASNIVNIVLVVVIFISKRHYVNIGTFIYIIPYGVIVKLGGMLYHTLFQINTLPIQITGAVLGCLFLYTGVAMYITADIGLDPFTGLVMTIRDKVGREYRKVKICFDIVCTITGFVLGGKLGVITIITALTAGPVIQFLSERIQGYMEKLLNK